MKIGYGRVSTRDQDPAMQEAALLAAGCERVWTEKASGVKWDRPVLTRILDEILRPGDTLVVWKLDRLARSVRQLTTTIEDLKKRGIAFQSLTEAIDTNTPTGMLVFHLMGSIAEFERELIRERSREGLKAARAKGRFGGRPRKMTKKDVLAAKAMMSAMTAAEVAKRFGVARGTLYRLIGEGNGQ